MRIAVLAHNLRSAGGLSTGRNMISCLADVGDAHDYLLILPADVGYEELTKPTRSTCHFCKIKTNLFLQLLRNERQLPLKIASWRPDVIWCLGNFGLANPPVPQAVLLQNAFYAYPPNWVQEDRG